MRMAGAVTIGVVIIEAILAGAFFRGSFWFEGWQWVLLLAGALLLPRLLQHSLAGSALLAATALVNLMPENPYLAYNQRLAQFSNVLNFHGLTALVDSLWPFLALAYLSALGLWRGEHLAARPGKALRNL